MTIRTSRHDFFDKFIIAMYKAELYNQLSILTGKSPAALERELDLGQGAINKALGRNSKVKPLTIDKIAKLYPEAAEKMGIEVQEGGKKEQAGITEESPTIISLLQESHNAVLETAKAAISAAQAVESKLNGLTSSVQGLERDCAEDRIMILSLEDFAIKNFAQALGMSEKQVRADLGNIWRARQKKHKGTPGSADKVSRRIGSYFDPISS